MKAMEAALEWAVTVVQALVPPHQVAHQGRFMKVHDDGNEVYKWRFPLYDHCSCVECLH